MVLAVLIIICSMMGLPWFVAATVRSVTHVRSLIKESELRAPGERPQFLGVRWAICCISEFKYCTYVINAVIISELSEVAQLQSYYASHSMLLYHSLDRYFWLPYLSTQVEISITCIHSSVYLSYHPLSSHYPIYSDIHIIRLMIFKFRPSQALVYCGKSG